MISSGWTRLSSRWIFFAYFVVIVVSHLEQVGATPWIRHILMKVDQVTGSAGALVPGEIAYDPAHEAVTVQLGARTVAFATRKTGNAALPLSRVKVDSTTVKILSGSQIRMNDGSLLTIGDVESQDVYTFDAIDSQTPLVEGWNCLWLAVYGSTRKVLASPATSAVPQRPTGTYNRIGYLGAVEVMWDYGYVFLMFRGEEKLGQTYFFSSAPMQNGAVPASITSFGLPPTAVSAKVSVALMPTDQPIHPQACFQIGDTAASDCFVDMADIPIPTTLQISKTSPSAENYYLTVSGFEERLDAYRGTN